MQSAEIFLPRAKARCAELLIRRDLWQGKAKLADFGLNGCDLRLLEGVEYVSVNALSGRLYFWGSVLQHADPLWSHVGISFKDTLANHLPVETLVECYPKPAAGPYVGRHEIACLVVLNIELLCAGWAVQP